MTRAALGARVGLEARMQMRHGTVLAVLGVAVAWVGLLALVPAADRAAVLPLVVYGDAGALGLVFAGGHVLLDRRDGVLPALATAGLTAADYVAARVLTLTLAGVAATAVVVAGSGLWSALPFALLAAVGLSGLALPVALIVAARTRDVTGYLVMVQVALLPVALPILAATGWIPWAVADLVPTAGPMRLLVAGAHGVPLGWADVGALAWTAVAAVSAMWLAARAVDRRLLHVGPAGHAVARRAPRSVRSARHLSTRSPSIALLAADARSVGRDPILRLLIGAPLLLAVIARFAVPILTDAAADRLGWDLAPHRPTMLALVLLVTPMLLGSVAGLLTLEDRDSGVLPVMLATPLTRRVLIGRRPLAAGLASGVALLASVPLSGLADPRMASLLPAIALAAGTAPLWALALPAVARDRAGGLAVGKALTIPAFAPLLRDAVNDPVRDALHVTPTWWTVDAVRSAWAGGAPVAAAWAGAAVTCVLAALLLALATRSADSA